MSDDDALSSRDSGMSSGMSSGDDNEHGSARAVSTSGPASVSSDLILPARPAISSAPTLGAFGRPRAVSSSAAMGRPTGRLGSRLGGMLRISVAPARGMCTSKQSMCDEVGYGPQDSGPLRLRAAASSMLGRRCRNEDAHVMFLPCRQLGSHYAWCGVFDGHGGDTVASFAAKWLPQTVAAHLRAAKLVVPAGKPERPADDAISAVDDDDDVDMDADDSSSSHGTLRKQSSTESGDSISVNSSGAQSNPDEPPESDACALLAYNLQDATQAFVRGFVDLDTRIFRELYRGVDADKSGTTALLALLTPTQVLVANTGDSRAVLCRAGKAVRMSEGGAPRTFAMRLHVTHWVCSVFRS